MASGGDDSSFSSTELEQKENHSDKNVPVARIPWIPLETGGRLQPGVLDLEKSNYFKEMVANKTNLQLFQLINHVFPFYLPKRYHTMDSWSLHKISKEGQYWANASHFLMANQAHEQIYFYNLFEELKKSSPDLSQYGPVFPATSREFLLKDGLEQCTSAAEFLLEPWILIQLPFQPILLHQWAAALMAEALKFQKEICDFYCQIYPKRFQMVLKQLFSMCDKMLQIAWYMLNFVLSYLSNGKFNLCNCVSPCLNYLSGAMAELMPILEFVLSTECRDIVKALKRMCWNQATMTKEGSFRECTYLKNNMCILEIPAIEFMYSYEFWKSNTSVHPSFVKPTFEHQNVDKRLKDEFDLNHKNKDIQRSDYEAIMKLIDNLIQLGRLKGEERDTILKAVYLDSQELKYMYFLHKTFSETSSAAKVVGDANAGVLYNLISLYSDLRVAEIMANFTTSIFRRVCSTTYPNWTIYSSAPDDCEGPSFDVKYIKKRLTKVLVPNNKWKYQNILAQVKETCFSPSRTKEPNFKQGAKKIADHFQERIKNLVFKMIEAQSKTINGPFSYYPECQVAQYLLPCFVASYLDLHQDPSASTKEKEDYLAFVHEIVKSYEDKEFCQKSSLTHRKLSFTSAVQSSVFEDKIKHWQKNVISSLAKIGNNKAIAQFHEKGLKLLCDCCHILYFFLHCPPIVELSPWTLQLFMILCRINSILENLTLLSADAPYDSLLFMLAICSCKIFIKQGRRPDRMHEKYLMWKLEKTFDHKSPSFSIMIEKEDLQNPKTLAQLADLEKITCVQLFGIVMFQYMAGLETDYLEMVGNDIIQGPGFPLDSIDAVFWSILSQDRWKQMQQLCTFLDSKLLRDTPYLASFTFAKSNQIYNPVLALISSDGEVQMSHPGEITFFPIKHCRWCGLVDVKEFRTCPECLDNPEYLDVNYFCSEKCGNDCLEKQHTEEHARFLLIKCDIDV